MDLCDDDKIESSFFELILVALEGRISHPHNLPKAAWEAILSISQRQAVAGVVFSAIEQLSEKGQSIPKSLLFEWLGLNEQIKQRNLLLNLRCKALERLLSEEGFRCCVLKGQGTALYYKNPMCRQSGDIDVWVTKDGGGKTEEIRREIVRLAKEKGYHVGHVDIKHSDIDFFEDVPVEVHFMPSWMFSPFKNRRLQRFFEEKLDKQFNNYDASVGFTHTTLDFDLVFSLVHIYRHVFEGGIGLRQLLDYYYILIHSNEEQRDEAYKVLKELGMSAFAGGIMWVLKECFAMNDNYFFCGANESHGKFLFSEILRAGNFGHYDTRYQFLGKEKRFHNGIINIKRNIHYLSYYPSEVLWSPIRKVWHWCWRKWKGYL